tara:strand:- start:60 stop:1280 length:1221 start_codon:yes stop_codon:yes gene_type:complete
MFKTDNSLHVFVGPQETSSIAAATAGDVFIVDETNAIISDGAITAAAHPYLKIGQKDANGNVRFTPLFKFANITSKVAREHDEDRSQQSSVFGSTGSAGSIDAINSNRYTVRVNFKNNVDMFSEQSDLHFFEYVSDANATQVEIANYFAQVMSKNAKFSGKNSGKNRASVKVERVTDSTLTASTSGTIAVTNGSKQVTAVTDIDDGGAAIVGGYLVLDSVAYKVVSISGQTATLDQPYQGATNSALGDGSTNEISAANAASGNWGLKITGLEQEWKLGLTPDAGGLITFDITVDGWGSTTAVATTAAVLGDGTARAIADLEWFAQGAAGAPYRSGTPNNADLITLYADGTLTTSYNTLELQVDLVDPGHAVAGSGKGKMTIVMAALEGASQALVTTALVTTGDAWD